MYVIDYLFSHVIFSWLNTSMAENRIILDNSELDGFDKVNRGRQELSHKGRSSSCYYYFSLSRIQSSHGQTHARVCLDVVCGGR